MSGELHARVVLLWWNQTLYPPDRTRGTRAVLETLEKRISWRCRETISVIGRKVHKFMRFIKTISSTDVYI
jgi:hypothetical protein